MEPIWDNSERYYGSGVEAIFRSQNNLFRGGGVSPSRPNVEESCQMSTATWCTYAIKRKLTNKDDPHIKDKERIRDYTCSVLQKKWFAPALRNPSVIIKEMTDILSWVGLKSTPLHLGPSHLEGVSGFGHKDEMLETIVGIRTPVMIWMHAHMVGAYAVSPDEIYFYDNTIGLSRCDSVASLMKFVNWACDKNSELTHLSRPKLQSFGEPEVMWKCVQCMK